MDRETEDKLIIDMRNEIKGYIRMRGYTYKNLAEKLQKTFGITTTPQSINNKLSRGSIKYSEVIKIAKVLGYKIKWEFDN